MKHIAFSLAMSVAALAFGAAQAAPSNSDQIRIVVNSAGLDLRSAAGADAFHARIKAAAFQACMESQGIDNTFAGQSLLDSCVHRTVKAALAEQTRAS